MKRATIKLVNVLCMALCHDAWQLLNNVFSSNPAQFSINLLQFSQIAKHYQACRVDSFEDLQHSLILIFVMTAFLNPPHNKKSCRDFSPIWFEWHELDFLPSVAARLLTPAAKRSDLSQSSSSSTSSSSSLSSSSTSSLYQLFFNWVFDGDEKNWGWRWWERSHLNIFVDDSNNDDSFSYLIISFQTSSIVLFLADFESAQSLLNRCDNRPL